MAATNKKTFVHIISFLSLRWFLKRLSKTNLELRAASKFLDEVKKFKDGLAGVFDMGGKHACSKKANKDVTEFIVDQVRLWF